MTIPVTRIALCLACTSAAFWLITGSSLPVGRGFPDCISIRKENSVAAVGFLSFDGLSSLFVVKDDFKDWDRDWSERQDGHFCGFPVPPYESYAAQPTGLTFQWTLDGIAWTCPYWLMTTLWLTVFIRSQSTFRFRLTDLFLTTAAVALTATLIRLHTALVLALPLNLATAALITFFLFRSLQLYLRNAFTLWPGPTKVLPTAPAA